MHSRVVVHVDELAFKAILLTHALRLQVWRLAWKVRVEWLLAQQSNSLLRPGKVRLLERHRWEEVLRRLTHFTILVLCCNHISL